MRLLIESINDCEFKVLEEGSEGAKSKKYMVRGPFMVAEEQNRNGRVYSKGILMREATRYTENYINNKRAYGELDHPASPNINLQNVSHMITDLKEDGNSFIGTAQLLDTPQGRTAQALVDAGCRLGVSSRGVGNIDNRGGKLYVKEDYHLITPADIVADPSAPRAFVDAMFESSDWIMQNGAWVQRFIEEKKKQVDDAARGEDRTKAMTEAFQSFLDKLGNTYTS